MPLLAPAFDFIRAFSPLTVFPFSLSTFQLPTIEFTDRIIRRNGYDNFAPQLVNPCNQTSSHDSTFSRVNIYWLLEFWYLNPDNY